MKRIFYIFYACMLTLYIHATPNRDQQRIYQEVTQCTHYLFGILQEAAQASYIGEMVSQLEHALQAAHQAELIDGSDELIIACLFHDIGHQLPGQSMDGWGTYNHEEIGALFCKNKVLVKMYVQ